MSDKHTGGPAFPLHSEIRPHRDTEWCGMTLRDYFAAKAMQGFCASAEAGDDVNVIPELSYIMADAMLKAREA